MAKAIVLLVSAICLLAFAGLANGHPGEKFTVEGRVYCDTCRVKFETKISENIPEAVVRLECRDMKTEKVMYSKEAKTNSNGTYSIEVTGDHEEDICDVMVVKSSRDDCKETVPELEKADVEISDNAGIHSELRYANPLFFMKDKVDERCKDVLKQLDYIPNDPQSV